MDLIALGTWAAWWAPQRCIACGAARRRSDWPLCEPCGEDVEPLDAAARAPLAGRPLVAGYRYRGAIATAITEMKFRAGAPGWSALLRDWVEASVALGGARGVEAWVAVPPHEGRLRARGWHLPDLLAQTLARRSGTIAPLWLRRTDDLGPRTLRRTGAGPTLVTTLARPPRQTRVALVDDVVSTGATLARAIAALEAAGVDVVQLVALADARKAEMTATVGGRRLGQQG